MKTDITIAGVTFKDVELPDANTPLPPTNATIHILIEDARPTHSIVLCGFTNEPLGKWPAGNMWFSLDEPHWYKHVTCAECLEGLKKKEAGIMSKRFFYTDPLAAAWMVRYHGLKIHGPVLKAPGERAISTRPMPGGYSRGQ